MPARPASANQQEQPSAAQAAVPAISLRFSHRLHIEKVRARCTDCHLKAAESTEAGDNLLPAERACLVCHTGGISRGPGAPGNQAVRGRTSAKKQARFPNAPSSCETCHLGPVAQRRAPFATTLISPPRIIRFSHKQHLALGDFGPILAAAVSGGAYLAPNKPAVADLSTGNACQACHRGVAKVDIATPANMPQMSDCLVCHTSIEPPFSCEFCHVKGVALKPASHTADFIDSHSRVKLDKSGCAVCHGRKFTCLGCH